MPPQGVIEIESQSKSSSHVFYLSSKFRENLMIPVHVFIFIRIYPEVHGNKRDNEQDKKRGLKRKPPAPASHDLIASGVRCIMGS